MNIERAEPADPSQLFHVEHVPGKRLPTKKKSKFRKFAPYLLGVILLGGAGGFYAQYSSTQKKQVDAEWKILALQGKEALTGAELRKRIIEENITAFWVGPLPGARYALSVLSDGQVFVRYLPSGLGIDDARPDYEVIGTYITSDAFTKVQEAAKSPNSISFVNQDGDMVFYSTLRPFNVYIGLKGTDFEVEVFNPTSGAALTKARTSGLIRKII
jgi:hypothetical protein